MGAARRGSLTGLRRWPRPALHPYVMDRAVRDVGAVDDADAGAARLVAVADVCVSAATAGHQIRRHALSVITVRVLRQDSRSIVTARGIEARRKDPHGRTAHRNCPSWW